MKKFAVSLFIGFAALMIAACGNIEEEKMKAETKVEEAFRNKLEDTNQTLGAVQFHLPSELMIKEESPNNIILVKGTHPYILFYNPNEDSNSEALYETTKQSGEKIIVDKTFTVEDQFGYFLIFEAGDNYYEIAAGIGGIKVTTKSTVENVAKDAEMMMSIVASTNIQDK